VLKPSHAPFRAPRAFGPRARAVAGAPRARRFGGSTARARRFGRLPRAASGPSRAPFPGVPCAVSGIPRAPSRTAPVRRFGPRSGGVRPVRQPGLRGLARPSPGATLRRRASCVGGSPTPEGARSLKTQQYVRPIRRPQAQLALRRARSRPGSTLRRSALAIGRRALNRPVKSASRRCTRGQDDLTTLLI
jgi:hypothetical protein